MCGLFRIARSVQRGEIASKEAKSEDGGRMSVWR